MNIKASIVTGLLSLGAVTCFNAVQAIASETSPQNPPSDIESIPDSLSVPDGNAFLLEASATGVQIYVCQASQENPEQFEWTLKAPEAELFAPSGEQIGTHYQGPTWEDNDGSKVVGEVLQRADAPDPDAIPWLLLRAKSHEGDGVFSQVTYIQRVNTVGGKAPAEGCDRSTAGTETRVNYTTDYYYYAAQ